MPVYTEFPLAAYTTARSSAEGIVTTPVRLAITLNNAPNATATLRFDYNVPLPVARLESERRQ